MGSSKRGRDHRFPPSCMRNEVNALSIASDLIRGHTETIILAQLMEKDSYGYEINRSVQQRTEKQYELKEATLYSAFRRLEGAGYIASYWGDENSGARRRYYSITDEGRRKYERNRREWEECKTLIDLLLRSVASPSEIVGGNE